MDKAYICRLTNVENAQQALSTSVEIDTLSTAMIRLLLNYQDPLRDLGLLEAEHSLVACTIQFPEEPESITDPGTLKEALYSKY